MNTTLLSMLVTGIIGSIIMVNGVAFNTTDILASANQAVNSANLRQIATVLELYYMDHDQYPNTMGGEELFNLFQSAGYVKNRPIDPSVFQYEATQGGQDYKLALAGM